MTSPMDGMGKEKTLLPNGDGASVGPNLDQKIPSKKTSKVKTKRVINHDPLIIPIHGVSIVLRLMKVILHQSLW